MLFNRLRKTCVSWQHRNEGVVVVEFALIFPVMMMMLLATVELGNGLMANQKVMAASQIVSDLMTRTDAVTDNQLAEAMAAGRMALAPFDQSSVGFDIVSVRFALNVSGDSDDEPRPVIEWRESDNIDAAVLREEDDIIEDVQPLALLYDGVVVVYVHFPYVPAFGTRFVGSINMIENTYARGRKTPVVGRDES